MTFRSGLSVVVLACVFVSPSGADDADDYRRAISQIESHLDYVKGYLHDVRGEQSDRSYGKIADAQSRVGEVRSLADSARARDVSTDEKRKADRYFEAARDFPESARALEQMKRLEVAFKDAGHPRLCADLDAKLKSHVEKLVSDKDHEGVQKIRDYAEQQARPVRDKLAGNRSQDGYMLSWQSTATRFSHTEGRWSDVSANLRDAANDSYAGWKRLTEDADRACEPITGGKTTRWSAPGSRPWVIGTGRKTSTSRRSCAGSRRRSAHLKVSSGTRTTPTFCRRYARPTSSRID